MFFGQIISYFGPRMGVDVFFIQNVWVVPVAELERRVTRAGIFSFIISKFRYR